jgi:hypothetical protein
MISTDNSTYLDYSFYTPEQKEFYNKTKNFLSKIKVSASDLQKTYDPELERFVPPKGSMQLWDNTVKRVDSYDLGKGLTVKLRLSSPKTNKKIDLNLRYFLNDFPNFLDKNQVITIDDLNVAFGNKKIKEVYSHLMPEILSSISDPSKKEFVDIKYNFKSLKYNIQLPMLYLTVGIKNPTYPTYITKLKNNITVFVGNSDRKYVPIYFNSLPQISYSEAEKIFNNPEETKYLVKNYSLDNIPGFYDDLRKKDSLPTDYLKFLKVVFNITDEFGSTYSKDIEYSINNIIPVSINLSDNINVINEGSSVSFILKTIGLPDGTQLFWDLEGNNIDDLDFESAEYKYLAQMQVKYDNLSKQSGLWFMSSMFNHSCASNAIMQTLGDMMMFYSIKDIQQDEEVTEGKSADNIKPIELILKSQIQNKLQDKGKDISIKGWLHTLVIR